MKKTFYSIALIALLFSCDKKNEGFVVSGTVKKMNGKHIMLSEITRTENRIIDSAIIDNEGYFQLSGQSSFPMLCALYVKDRKDYLQLILKNNEDVEVTIHDYKFPIDYDVSGSPDSEKIKKMQEGLFDCLNKKIDLKKEFSKMQDSIDIETARKELINEIKKMDREYKQKMTSFIKDNTQSIAALVALYQQIGYRQNLFSRDKDAALFLLVDSVLFKNYPSSEPVLALHEQVLQMKSSAAYIGKAAPEIELPGVDEKKIALSNFRGKYVLLDFWASWCPPCRKENPELVRIYKKYQGENFEIFGVSLDKSKAAWVKAIKDDKLDWVHVSDLKFWDSPVVMLYGIEGVPSSFLISPDGKIIAKNLHVEELDAKLAEIFNE